MMIKLIRVISVFLILVTSSAVLAKCPVGYLEVKGTLNNLKNFPVGGVRIGIFADDSTQGIIAVTLDSGHFQVKIPYKTYSGSYIWGDSCNNRLKRITIVAIPYNYKPLKFEQTIADEQLVNGIDVNLVLLDND